MLRAEVHLLCCRWFWPWPSALRLFSTLSVRVHIAQRFVPSTQALPESWSSRCLHGSVSLSRPQTSTRLPPGTIRVTPVRHWDRKLGQQCEQRKERDWLRSDKTAFFLARGFPKQKGSDDAVPPLPHPESTPALDAMQLTSNRRQSGDQLLCPFLYQLTGPWSISLPFGDTFPDSLKIIGTLCHVTRLVWSLSRPRDPITQGLAHSRYLVIFSGVPDTHMAASKTL